jgi:MGT family glycosyltransferase
MPAMLSDAPSRPATPVMQGPRAADPATATKTFLVAHWEGGGNTPPMLGIVRRLLQRGHAVRVISDPCNRGDVEGAGASFASWRRAPHRADKSVETDVLRDWEVTSPLAMLGLLRDRLFIGPSLQYAQDILEELQRFPADVVVTSEMLFGVMAGAEAAGVPCVSLCANVYPFPQKGVPPFGPGLQPSAGPLGRLRDWFITTMATRQFAKGAAAFNATRKALMLAPLAHPFDQLGRLASHIVLTSREFDFASPEPPKHFLYAGAVLDDPAWADPWQSPWPSSDRRPLVLVGFSTTYQNQGETLGRVIEALGQLDVRAVVTAGPAMDRASLPAAPNVHVCASAPHSELLKEAAVAITHCGHGTVIRALAAGVPLVCMPMGRDQNDNAARVTARGAGVRLTPKASAEKIHHAVRQLLTQPQYRERARRLGELIVADARQSKAVPELERVAARALLVSSLVRG